MTKTYGSFPIFQKERQSQLQDKLLPGNRQHGILDISRSQQRVGIRERVRSQRSFRRRVRALTPKNSINNHRIPILFTTLCIHHLLTAVLENGTLHKSLSAHSCVHARVLLVVIVVEDMRSAEAQQWAARGDFVEVVVRVGDAEMTNVF